MSFSTAATLDDPASWSKPKYLYPHGSPKRKWLDFWIICDEAKAHLFFTSLNGRMWRAETALADFPHGWGAPRLALRADIFEVAFRELQRRHGCDPGERMLSDHARVVARRDGFAPEGTQPSEVASVLKLGRGAARRFLKRRERENEAAEVGTTPEA